ncbi:MAG TPA: accessory factor UbiK family protein [Chromatiales bacterium]|nr:accessory factor UbiK family protein [Chromatiales bacterium]
MSQPTPPSLDQIIDRVLEALPDGLRELRDDAQKNLRAALHSALARMDLVTREEFDIQCKVLARTRARLEELERQVERLEQGQGTRDE